MKGDVVVYLHSGESVDISDMTPERAIDLLLAKGVTTVDIKHTLHRVRASFHSITCPRCGRTSYNANDIRERYCGACHQFHKEAHGC